MTEPFVSHAQNHEDVVLWRALAHIANGRYVDVGACDPVEHSVTKAFYDRGWRGIDIDPVPEYAARLREQRPGNEIVEAAITSSDVGEIAFHQLVGTGLSTLDEKTAEMHKAAGFEHREIIVQVRPLDDVLSSSALSDGEIHFMKIDVEGAEAEVLQSVDFQKWRPWVMVVEATEPRSTRPSHFGWEPVLLTAGYSFCLFDGLSRFYVAKEHADLTESLSYPACVLDAFWTAREDLLSRRLAQAGKDMALWRNRAVSGWADSVERLNAAQKQSEQARRALSVNESQNRLLHEQVAALNKRLAAFDRRFEVRMRRKLGRILRRLGLR